MTYIDGFVIACPKANKDKFIAHANMGDSVFMDLGATRVLECWADEVPEGKTTDFRMAVKAEADEAVLFSWIEYPDKVKRDEIGATMMEWMSDPAKADPRMDPAKNPMPFDGTRMIFGGFKVIVDTGPVKGTGFIDGFVMAVPKANEATYRDYAKAGAAIFMDIGATRVVETWADDVPHGKTTDFYGAVKAMEDEAVVFSWIEYPDKAARDKAGELMMSDPRFEALGPMPLDGKRMIYAGFAPVVTLER
jgi:uncharacterized protein YbaA (DUF1428 family)